MARRPDQLFGRTGITGALLQGIIKGGVSLLTPLLQSVDRHPELTAE